MTADDDSRPCAARRRLLTGSTALALCAHALPGFAAGADADAEKRPPQPGDELVLPSYEDGRLLAAADLVAGGDPVLVYPRDPITGVVRERSRLNQILVVRLDLALDETTRNAAADDVVAYSAVCTHTACGVTGWKSEVSHFVCPCHQSEFAAARHGTRVAGPAPRALPLLPIRVSDERYLVAGAFSSRVGASKP